MANIEETSRLFVNTPIVFTDAFLSYLKDLSTGMLDEDYEIVTSCYHLARNHNINLLKLDEECVKIRITKFPEKTYEGIMRELQSQPNAHYKEGEELLKLVSIFNSEHESQMLKSVKKIGLQDSVKPNKSLLDSDKNIRDLEVKLMEEILYSRKEGQLESLVKTRDYLNLEISKLQTELGLVKISEDSSTSSNNSIDRFDTDFLSSESSSDIRPLTTKDLEGLKTPNTRSSFEGLSRSETIARVAGIWKSTERRLLPFLHYTDAQFKDAMLETEKQLEPTNNSVETSVDRLTKDYESKPVSSIASKLFNYYDKINEAFPSASPITETRYHEIVERIKKEEVDLIPIDNDTIQTVVCLPKEKTQEFVDKLNELDLLGSKDDNDQKVICCFVGAELHENLDKMFKDLIKDLKTK